MITKNYIKMCEEAEEIQKLLNKPRPAEEWKHSYYVEKFKKENYRDIEYEEFCGESLIGRKIIFLPTQEQLWGKVWEIEKTCTFNHRFNIYQYDKNIIGLIVNAGVGYSYEYFMDTLQECLLAYIYEKGYNKLWTGEKWVKEE